MDHQASNASVEAKTCSTGSDNPFMALVDAATSIFESKQETKNESPNQDLLAGSDNDENTIANSRGEYKTESSASAISKSTSRDETVLSNKKTNMKTKRSSTKLTFSEQLMRVLDNEDKKKDGTLAWKNNPASVVAGRPARGAERFLIQDRYTYPLSGTWTRCHVLFSISSSLIHSMDIILI